MNSDYQRLDGWATALRALHDQPAWRWLFGWGPETFRSVYRLHRTQEAADLIGHARVADHAHNLPLELLVTLGLVGTAAVAYLGWHLWRKADDEGRACMLGLLVMSMFEPVFFPPAALLFIILGAQGRQLAVRHWRESFWAILAAAVLTVACLGVWVDDVWGGLAHHLALHPRESEANQYAVEAALGRGKLNLAVLYGKRAAAADPRHTELVRQAAEFEAAVKRRR